MEQNHQENPNLFEKPHNLLEVTTIKAQNIKKKKKKKVILVNQGLNCIIEHKSIHFFFSLKGKFRKLGWKGNVDCYGTLSPGEVSDRKSVV